MPAIPTGHTPSNARDSLTGSFTLSHFTQVVSNNRSLVVVTVGGIDIVATGYELS